MIPGLVVQGSKCRVGGSLGGRDTVPLAQATVWVPASTVRALQRLQGPVGSSVVPPGSAAWAQGRSSDGQSWRRAHTWLWRPAAGACVVAGAGHRLTRSGGEQGQSRGLGPSVGPRQLRGPWQVVYSPRAAESPHRCVHNSGGW